MPTARQYAVSAVGLGLVSLAHAILTWPLAETILLFGGGVLIAFLAEAIGVEGGWLEHHIDPAIRGVPLYLLPGWVGVIYVALRLAQLVATGVPAVFVAATLATGYDVLTDHTGVEAGFWTYHEGIGGPRFRGIPWWNFAAWFCISGLTASLPVLLG